VPPVTDLFVKCHLKLHIDVTSHNTVSVSVCRGSILASLDTFKKMWVSKKEYESEGLKAIHRKTFWFLSRMAACCLTAYRQWLCAIVKLRDAMILRQKIADYAHVIYKICVEFLWILCKFCTLFTSIRLLQALGLPQCCNSISTNRNQQMNAYQNIGLHYICQLFSSFITARL